MLKHPQESLNQCDKKSCLTILILVDILDIMGGAERNIYILTNGLIARGHRVIVCPIKGGFVARKMKQEGVDVRELNILRIYDFKGLMALARLISVVKKEGVTTLLTYHESADFLGLSTAFLSKVPIISSRRDTGFKLKKRHIMLYQVVNRFFTHILANSSAVKESIVRGQQSNLDTITIIPNGVDIFPVNNNKKGPVKLIDDDQECLNICCIANIRPIKGYETLIHAAALVIKKIPDVCFYLVGSYDGNKDYYDTLTAKVTELGIEEQIKFTGEVHFSQVPAILSAMDICVLPSLSEGMSNTLLEYMSAGKPAVATSVGGNPELVEHGQTGFLVLPKAPEAMAEAIIKLLLQPDLRLNMGKQARDKAEREFNTEIMVDKVEALMRKNWIRHS